MGGIDNFLRLLGGHLAVLTKCTEQVNDYGLRGGYFSQEANYDGRRPATARRRNERVTAPFRDWLAVTVGQTVECFVLFRRDLEADGFENISPCRCAKTFLLSC